MTRILLIVTALLEAATGFALMAAPSLVVSLLLGVTLDTPGGLPVAQVAGAALLSLGLACWLARDHGGSMAGRAIVTAMLLYNFVIVALLAYSALALSTAGIGLWPAVGAHLALGSWCAARLVGVVLNPSPGDRLVRRSSSR